MKILLATPSRGRPDGLRQMAESALERAYDPANVQIVVRCDEDDLYVDLAPGIIVLPGPRKRLPLLWNEIADNFSYDIIMMCADDVRFRTYGWDSAVRGVFDVWPDRIGHVYTRDGVHDQRLGTHSFVSREWVEAVGYYLPESLTGDYVDNFLYMLGAHIERSAYLPDVYIEHLHPAVSKAPMDPTYAYRLSPQGITKARTAWENLIEGPTIETAINQLRRAIENTDNRR